MLFSEEIISSHFLFLYASLKVCAAVINLGLETETGFFFRFIASMIRDLKGHTIPGLELISALLLARLMTSVSEVLKLNLHHNVSLILQLVFAV